MAGLVEDLTPREDALSLVSSALGFPWGIHGGDNALCVQGCRILKDIVSDEDFPPFPRSTRDGYAVLSSDCFGASAGNPAFLRLAGEVPMGVPPSFRLNAGECALIHTGGILPEGSDAVVMMEDTDSAGDWVELKNAVQKTDNTVSCGEEFSRGDVLLQAGRKIDFRTSGLLAMAGVMEAESAALRVGIISTGDEIVPPGTMPLPPGKFRDVNSALLTSLIRGEGYQVSYYGIAEDSKNLLASVLEKALSECGTVVISGGSSVSMRDHCSSILEDLPEPGLLIRGILMSPGKPTLIAGLKDEKKLVLGLPGHPFSCFLSAYTVLLPLLNAMIWGKPQGSWRKIFLPSEETVFGHSGIEEFIPCILREGRVFPYPVKSSFSKALALSDGLYRLPASQETIRSGEEAEIWLW